jgi:hypothetical protein
VALDPKFKIQGPELPIVNDTIETVSAVTAVLKFKVADLTHKKRPTP